MMIQEKSAFADLKVKFRNQKRSLLLVMDSIVHVKFMKILLIQRAVVKMRVQI